MDATSASLLIEPRVVAKLPPAKSLRWVWILLFGSLIVGGQIFGDMAMQPGADRKAISQWLNSQSLIVNFLLPFAAMYVPACRKWTSYERLQGVVIPFLLLSYFIQLTWELGFVLLSDQIALAKNEAWAYTWWSYLDGGDYRYLHAEPPIVTMEILGILNACVGVIGLIWLYRTKFTDYRATLVILCVEAIQIPLTWYYYLSEILSGYKDVDTESFIAFYVTFWGVNAPWLILPWFAVYWAVQTLRRQFAIAASASGARLPPA